MSPKTLAISVLTGSLFVSSGIAAAAGMTPGSTGEQFLAEASERASASVTCRLVRVAYGSPQELVFAPFLEGRARDFGQGRVFCNSLDDPPSDYSVDVEITFQAGDGETFSDLAGTSRTCHLSSVGGQIPGASCTNVERYPVGDPAVGPLHRAKFILTTPNGTSIFFSPTLWPSDLVCGTSTGAGTSSAAQDGAVGSARCSTGDISRSYSLALSISPQYLDASTGEWVPIDSVTCTGSSVAGQSRIDSCLYARDPGPTGAGRRTKFVLEADRTRIVQYFPG